ncbi:hypothetical protein CCUS01_09697 [Colletotrichum cuscutae]|uniref:Uncharacterized protein n=1 Tax=Colletotrichum cuscutae TaxID=1209917 RepID=A0AAI9UKF5_9PEZI|nr:hypothetical protein CCUS01_09697 [Colletotrichum cuscutae]
MPVLKVVVTPKSRCEKSGCELTKFTTRSNLKKHTQSKHGTAIPMSCGKALPNHKSNIRRHQKSCGKSCMALDQLSAPTEQVSFESPTSATTAATETTNFDFDYGFYTEETGEMGFLIADLPFGDHCQVRREHGAPHEEEQPQEL